MLRFIRELFFPSAYDLNKPRTPRPSADSGSPSPEKGSEDRALRVVNPQG